MLIASCPGVMNIFKDDINFGDFGHISQALRRKVTTTVPFLSHINGLYKNRFSHSRKAENVQLEVCIFYGKNSHLS